MPRSIDSHECKSPIFPRVSCTCEYLLVTSRLPRCVVNSREPRLQILRSKLSLSIPAHGIEPAKIPRCITGQIQISVVDQHIDAILKCKLDLVHCGLVKIIVSLECGWYLFWFNREARYRMRDLKCSPGGGFVNVSLNIESCCVAKMVYFAGPGNW